MTPADGDDRFELPQMPRPTDRDPDGRRTPAREAAPPPPPSDDDVVTVHDRPHPHRTRLLITAAVAVVVVVAVIVAGLVWGPGSPLTQPSPSAGPTSGSSASPVGPLALPDRFGNFSVKPATRTEGPVDSADDLVVTSATYTQNGVDSILLIAAAPADDMRSFLLSLGASDLHEVEGGWCATYQEIEVCGVVTETRAYAVSPLAEQTEAELIVIAREASAAPV